MQTEAQTRNIKDKKIIYSTISCGKNIGKTKKSEAVIINDDKMRKEFIGYKIKLKSYKESFLNVKIITAVNNQFSNFLN